LLGDFNLEDYTATFNVRASIVLFYIFMFLVQIIFLNLLIAIMGDIYDEIQENAKSQFLFSKASIILEFESIMRTEEKRQSRGTRVSPSVFFMRLSSMEVKEDRLSMAFSSLPKVLSR
jgi:hypothetical protein